jgi:hypothetical protein
VVVGYWGGMGKRITDNDAFAGGIAAYAMMQSLLKRLEETGTPLQVIRDIIENAARFPANETKASGYGSCHFASQRKRRELEELGRHAAND